MKKFLFTLICIINVVDINAQQYSSFIDSRDGVMYRTVEIFGQIWMAENLRTEKFQNGDRIKKVNTSQEWINACLRKEPVWMYYQNNIDYGKKFGKIYNYYAIVDKRNIAPTNYHLPTKNEFISLAKISSSNLKSNSGWYSTTYTRKVLANVDRIDRNGFPYVDLDFVEKKFTLGGFGNNSSGFDAFPAGKIESNGISAHRFEEIDFWSSTSGDLYNTQSALRISWDDNEARIFNSNYTQGFYVRCVSGKSMEEKEFENEQKIRREKFIADSIFIEKVNYEKFLDDLNQKREDSLNIIKKTILIKQEDSIRNSLNLFDVFQDGIVIKLINIDGQFHGLLLSEDEDLLKIDQVIEKYSKIKDNWRLPFVSEMRYVVNLIKNDKKFNDLFINTMYKGNTHGWGKADWWYALPDNTFNLTSENLWWVFKSSLGKDQQILKRYTETAVQSYSRLRLVKEF